MSAASRVRRRADAVRKAGAAQAAARGGYVARGAFYVMLAYLVVQVVSLHGRAAQQAVRAARSGGAGSSHGRQANAQGAITLLSGSVAGTVALAVAALGFLALGLVRLVVAVRDSREARLRRVSVAGQGLVCLAAAWIPTTYLFGNHSAGSEQQSRRSTERLLGLPGGQVIVVIVGVVLLIVCGWQVRGVWRQDFTDGLRLNQAPGWFRRPARVIGSVGIVGRALVFLPIGIFLIIAGFTFDPRRARGLDDELLLLSAGNWGKALLAVVAVVLATFAAYSLIEARYRDVERSA